MHQLYRKASPQDPISYSDGVIAINKKVSRINRSR